MHGAPMPVQIGIKANFMRKQPGIVSSPTGILTVLSVSPVQEDHRSLEGIIDHSNWTFLKADSLPRALTILQQQRISVVVCEWDLMSGVWVDILSNIKHLPDPPCLIVTSRLADERLWADALNLGAWDVLAKPFASGDVLRSVAQAGLHWHHQLQMPALSMKVMTVAS
jgi:DNA-binding response OmpR family regulator